MFQTMQQSSSANSNPASSVQKGNAMQAPLMLNTFPWLAYVPRPSTDPHSNAHYPRPLLTTSNPHLQQLIAPSALGACFQLHPSHVGCRPPSLPILVHASQTMPSCVQMPASQSVPFQKTMVPSNNLLGPDMSQYNPAIRFIADGYPKPSKKRRISQQQQQAIRCTSSFSNHCAVAYPITATQQNIGASTSVNDISAPQWLTLPTPPSTPACKPIEQSMPKDQQLVNPTAATIPIPEATEKPTNVESNAKPVATLDERSSSPAECSEEESNSVASVSPDVKRLRYGLRLAQLKVLRGWERLPWTKIQEQLDMLCPRRSSSPETTSSSVSCSDRRPLSPAEEVNNGKLVEGLAKLKELTDANQHHHSDSIMSTAVNALDVLGFAAELVCSRQDLMKELSDAARKEQAQTAALLTAMEHPPSKKRRSSKAQIACPAPPASVKRGSLPLIDGSGPWTGYHSEESPAMPPTQTWPSRLPNLAEFTAGWWAENAEEASIAVSPYVYGQMGRPLQAGVCTASSTVRPTPAGPLLQKGGVAVEESLSALAEAAIFLTTSQAASSLVPAL